VGKRREILLADDSMEPRQATKLIDSIISNDDYSWGFHAVLKSKTYEADIEVATTPALTPQFAHRGNVEPQGHSYAKLGRTNSSGSGAINQTVARCRLNLVL
jgi:hypothetical protein